MQADPPGAVNLTAPSQVSALLRRHSIRPNRRLGQHFLIDRNILEKVVRAAELASGDRVLEVGPGLGTLTRELARRAELVVAVELDRALQPVLAETIGGLPNVRLEFADIMKADLGRLCPGPGPWKVVANLPYYITGPLMDKLLSFGRGAGSGVEPFPLLVVMVQEELAERMVAPPGTKDYGAFSVLVNYYAQPELVSRVPATAFLPPPKVGSAIVRLRGRRVPAAAPEPVFFAVVRAAFTHRRKALKNSLAAGLRCDESLIAESLRLAGIDGDRRGETLSLEEFGALAQALASRLPAAGVLVENGDRQSARTVGPGAGSQ